MDLFVAAILLKHPTQGQRIAVDYQLAERITDASSAILQRVQKDGWEAFETQMHRADDLNVKETAAYRARVHVGEFLEESDDLMGAARGADYIGVSFITFLTLLERFNIEPVGITEQGERLYDRLDLELPRALAQG